MVAANTTPEPTTAQKYGTFKPKMALPLVASYIGTIVFYTLSVRWDIDPPAEVAVAIMGLIGALVAFLAPDAPQQTNA